MPEANSESSEPGTLNPNESRTDLRRQIEEYYLPTQLVEAILGMGEFPTAIEVTDVGIGFLDIADYSRLSLLLTPWENQDVLNGLYTAFHQVLQKHNGYLNKIEGDSIMFHFGGNIDANVRGMERVDAQRYVARELFNTCVELQRKCSLFNEANQQFLAEAKTTEVRSVLEKAFRIITEIRNNPLFGELYQIRVRIGASIGEVTIGNFGPEGAKQWDVIGSPVIEAKRMESTAPIGGLRISKSLYDILESSGKVDEYYTRFKREAQLLDSRFSDITKEDLFRESSVLLKDKGNVSFETYKVQVTAQLPNRIADQVRFLVRKGPGHTGRIMELIQYYRGNRYVMWSIEDAFNELDVQLRKGFLFKIMYPGRYQQLVDEQGGESAADQAIAGEHSLFDLLDRLGRFQDIVKQRQAASERPEFGSYESYMQDRSAQIRDDFENNKDRMVQRAYFYNVVYPLTFESIETSIRERQHEMGLLEELPE